jgi:serine phosphatase RsbU (regulator of sigma subunit)
MTSSELTNEKLFGLTDTLKKQLQAYSTSNEIGKITAQAQNIEEVLNGLCLGFKDLAGYKRVMILGIDSENFCLKPLHSVGFDREKLKYFRPEMNFMAGEYVDAIFCNKHIYLDSVPKTDSFSLFGCKAYITFPLLRRTLDECWKVKKCQKTNCPSYNSKNQFCWTDLEAGLCTNATSEDDRRHQCVKCSQFKCEGLLWLDLTNRTAITGEDTAMIYAAVTQAGLIIESFRAYEDLKEINEKLNVTYAELQKAHHSLKADLQEASLIQQQLLPTNFPKGLSDVFAEYKANLYVGGDYYDCFELNNNVIAFVVADVSGHGSAAAMLMSMFKIMLKSSPLNGISPALTLKNINETLVSEIDSGKFITVFYAIWSKNTNEFIYTSAGHNPMPIMNRKTGEIELLKSSGFFIGMMPDIMVEDKVLKLNGEYRISLYTDGINEAMNSKKEQFGHKRIHELMKESAGKSCKEFVETLLHSVDNFCDGQELADDATILVCDL